MWHVGWNLLKSMVIPYYSQFEDTMNWMYLHTTKYISMAVYKKTLYLKTFNKT